MITRKMFVSFSIVAILLLSMTGLVFAGGAQDAAKVEEKAVEEPKPEVKIVEDNKEDVYPMVADSRGKGTLVSTHNMISRYKTFVKTLRVSGVVGEKVKAVKVNGQVVKVDENGRFEAFVPLTYGKNSIVLKYDDKRL